MFFHYLYLCASFVAPVFFIADTASECEDFFTTVVELTNSPLFELLCVNAFIAFVIVFWLVSRWLFFGKLNKDETDAVHRALPVYISECVIGPYFFNVSIFSIVGAASLLTVAIRLLHKLAEERVTTLPIAESRAHRMRMLRGLFFFIMLLLPLDLYVVFDLWAVISLSHESVSGLRYTAALLYMQFAIANVQCLVRIGFSKGGGDFVKTSLTFYAETLVELFRCAVFFVSFSYVSAVSQLPLPLMRLLFRNVTIFFEKSNRLYCYWRLTQFVSRIPNATESELARDPRCPVCHDDMSPREDCKRLPCGHCYHEPCLRRCFEAKSSCPYCGTDLITHMRRGQTARTQQRETQQQQPSRRVAAGEEGEAVDEAGVARAYAQYRMQFRMAQGGRAPRGTENKSKDQDKGKDTQSSQESREQQRIAAYRMYEESIRAASIALEAQLQAIDA